MKKSIVFSLVLLLTVLGYGSFVVTASLKIVGPDRSIVKKSFPALSELSIGPDLYVHLFKSSEIFLKHEVQDTSEFRFESGSLSLSSSHRSVYSSEPGERSLTDMNYRVGLSEAKYLEIGWRDFVFVDGFDQDSMTVVSNAQSRVQLMNVVLDTLVLKGFGEVVISRNCRIGAILVRSSEGTTPPGSIKLVLDSNGDDSISIGSIVQEKGPLLTLSASIRNLKGLKLIDLGDLKFNHEQKKD